MAVEIVEAVKEDEEQEEQLQISGPPKPEPIGLTGDTAPDYYTFAEPIKVGEPEEPGFFSKAFDAFDEWRNKEKPEKFSREEAREITLENLKLNREIMGNKGYGPFSFGSSRAPNQSALVRAGLEDPPEEKAEGALLPYLREDPFKDSSQQQTLTPDQSRISKERMKWKTYPKDPNGFLIDPTRPMLMNEDGSSSSEVSITIEAGGRFWNVPSIINGKRYNPGNPEDFEKIIAHTESQMKKGWIYPNFDSEEEAIQAAKARSDSIKPARAEWREGEYPTTEDEWDKYLKEKKEEEPAPEEDPWGLVIWDHVTSTPALFKRQYGGAKAFLNAPRDLVYIIEAAADQGVAPEDSFALQAEAYVRGKDPAAYYQELLDELERNEDFHEGIRLHREGTRYLQTYAPKVNEGSLKWWTGAVIEGTINMTPALVTSAVTRSPTMGAALMGGQVFADQYVESIERGRSHSQAVMDSTVFAAAEILTERIPLGILTKEGGTLLARILKSAGAEAIQEPITQLIQEGYTMGIIDEEMTFGEALVEIVSTPEGRAMLRRSAAVGAGVGGALAAAVHPLYGGMTEADVPTPPRLKEAKPILPSERTGAITEDEAEDLGLATVEVTRDLLERVAAGDPLTLDEQYTLTEGGYGKFINDGERVVMNPKGLKLLRQLRDEQGSQDEEGREGVPMYRRREARRLHAGEQISTEKLPVAQIEVPDRLADIVGELPEISDQNTVESGWFNEMRDRIKAAYPDITDMSITTAFLEGEGIGQAVKTPTPGTKVLKVNKVLSAVNALIEKYDMVRQEVPVVTEAARKEARRMLGDYIAMKERFPTAMTRMGPELEKRLDTQWEYFSASQLQEFATLFEQLETVPAGDIEQINQIKGQLEALIGSIREAAEPDEPDEGTVVDEQGEPIIVWRGEHGLRDTETEEFQTRVGSLSFGSLRTATEYANEPNDRTKDRIARDPRVQGYTIQINNPFINSKDDPFIDLSEIRRKLGNSAVNHVVNTLGGEIMNTNNWAENFAEEFADPAEVMQRAPERVDSLYLPIYPVLDDAEMVKRMKRKGYDGAIHQGMGTNFDEIEYRIFDQAQAKRIPTIDIAVEAPAEKVTEVINKYSTDSVASQKARLDKAAHEAETSQYDTREQSEELLKSGKYEKGHIRFHGIPITIENPRGSWRTGRHPKSQRKWRRQLAHHYGYIKGVKSVDKDQLDVFIGPNPQSLKVFIINQKKDQEKEFSSDNFDEHKVMLGFDSFDEAMQGYWANYPKSWRGHGTVSVMTMPQFKQWITTPFTQLPAPSLELTEAGKEFGYHEFLEGGMTYIRNTEPAPDLGERFQQHIEPVGKYVLHDKDKLAELPPGWVRGETNIHNPLLIPLNSKGANVENIYDQYSWKRVLSDQYGGLTGAALTNALRDEGYDAIITVNIDNKSVPFETSEIVLLKRTREEATTELSPLQVTENEVTYKVETSSFNANAPDGVTTVEAFNAPGVSWDFESPNVKLIETGSFRAARRTVSGDMNAQAHTIAHITGPLRREAQESLMMVVAGEDNKVRTIIRHSKGATDMAPAELPILLGSIFGVKGGRKAWMVHNHPSGTATHSEPDIELVKKIKRELQGTGVEFMSSVVISPGGTATYIDPETAQKPEDSVDIVIAPGRRIGEIPIVERRFRKIAEGSGSLVTSPNAAVSFAKTLPEGDHFVLMNPSMRVIGTVPIQNMEKLRTKNVGTGAGAVLAAIHRTNANVMFSVTDTQEGANNAIAFGEDIGMRMIEALVRTDEPYLDGFRTFQGTQAWLGRNHKYRHKRPKTNSGRGVPVEKVQSILRPIYQMFRTVPPVRVVEAIEDLPKHLQLSLETEEDRKRTTGFYDQGGWLDTIYIVANNVTDTQEAIETMLHEVVGHFGLHQILDPWAFNDIMDRIAESFEKQVRQIAKDYELDWNNIDQRRIAAEEFIAHTAQKVLAGVKTTRTERSLLDAVITAIKNFLRRMTGKPTLFTDGQIMSMIAEASTYVQTPGGYKRDLQRGRLRHVRPPTFFSKLWKAFNESDMKSGSAQSWDQFIKSQIKKGGFKKEEARWLRFIKDEKDKEATTWFEDVTWNDIYRLTSGKSVTGPTIEDQLPQLEKFLPYEIVEKLKEQRALQLDLRELKEKSKKLRDEAYLQQFPAEKDLLGSVGLDSVKAQQAKSEWEAKNPAVMFLTPGEQRDYTLKDELWEKLSKELDTFGRTTPKKIPKDAVMSYIERNGVAISIENPAGGDPDDAPYMDEDYPDYTEEPNEDDWFDYWTEIEQQHWDSFYNDILDEVYDEHKWNKFRDEDDQDLGWDGTSENDMEEEASDRTREEIEGDYYNDEREEWLKKNTSKEWYYGEYNIRTDHDGDYIVYHEGDELGYDSDFNSALQIAQDHHENGSTGTRWSEYMLEPVGEDYEELLFKWTNPERTLFTYEAHWSAEDENYVAHVRFDVRADTDGNPVIYIDEMQSDWAQSIRDRIKEVLDEIHRDHGYDENYINDDGTIGGGPDWDGTPVKEMADEARESVGADPEKAQKEQRKADKLYEEIKKALRKVKKDLYAPMEEMNEELVDELLKRVSGQYSDAASHMLSMVRNDALNMVSVGQQRHGDLTDAFIDQEMEKRGMYRDLNWPRQMVFAAYRIEVRELDVPSSSLTVQARRDFEIRVIERAISQDENLAPEIWDTDYRRMIKNFETAYETPMEVDGVPWNEYLYEQGVVNSSEWNTHPKDIADWDGDIRAAETARFAAEKIAHEALMDESDESPSATKYRAVIDGQHWPLAYKNQVDHLVGQEERYEHILGQLYKIWHSLHDHLASIAAETKDKTTRMGKFVEEFDVEPDTPLRSKMGHQLLEFEEAEAKARQYKDGIIFPPFEKDWQVLVMKAMIFEAMQRGHDRIYISKGEPHGVRWSGADTVSYVNWKKNIIEDPEEQHIDSRTSKPGDKKPIFHSYFLNFPEKNSSVTIPANALRKTVGDRVAWEISRSEDAEGQVRAEDVDMKAILIPSEYAGKRLTGSRKIYNELAPNNINKFLKQYKARMVPTYVPGKGRLPPGEDSLPERAGLHVKREPSKEYENWSKATVRPLTDKEIEDLPMVVKRHPQMSRADAVRYEIAGRFLPEQSAQEARNRSHANMRSGISEWDGTVYGVVLANGTIVPQVGASRPWRRDAEDYRDQQLEILRQGEWGYEAFEIEFTPELYEAMKTGFPLFHKRGGKRRTGDPGLDEALDWAEKNIGPQGPRSIERIQERVNEILRIEQKQAKIEQAMIDQFAGLKWAIRQTHGHDLPAEISGYKQAHFTTSLDSQMYVFLTHGVPHWETVGEEGEQGTITQIKPGSKGLLEILEPVADRIQFWGYWMAARRADRLLKEGREALFTQERVDELLKLGERFPEFQDVADDYHAWKTEFLDWASEAGVINEDTRPLWDLADYVPFYRVKADEIGGSFSKKSGFGGPGIANVTQPIKRLLGSKHPLGDILENIIVNFMHIADTAMKNKAAQLAIENLEGSGLITTVPGKEWMKQEFIPLDELKRKLKQAGVDWQAMDDEALAGMQKMWTLQRPSGDDIISVLYNGKKKYFKVHEETLLRSLTAINERAFSSVIGRMFMWLPRKIKRLGTTMITLAPDFMAANWFRDVFMAFVNSRHAKLPKPWSGITGAWKAFTRSEEMVSMMAAGGAFYSGYINANDPVSTTKAMKRALRQTGYKNRILDAPWKLFHFYNDLGAASENANRIGSAYIPAIKAGVGKAEAVWESKDLMNFAKHGDHIAMQFFAQSVMFLNARIQGLTRYGQRFAEAPGITFAKSLMYSMAVLAMWLRNKDDDRYKALPDEDKDMNIHFWIGDKHWRLPKSFEVGMVFGVGVERMFEYFYSNETDAGRVAIDRMWFVLGEVFNFFNPQTFVPLPQFIQPLYEASNNWNAFFQSPIVPEYMMDMAEVAPELAFRPQTSPLMREIARVMPDFAPSMMKNPMLLEHLVRGYFGTLGAYVMVMSDELVRKQFDYPARPALRWNQHPVIGRFYRGEDPPSRTNWEEIMYEVRNNARQIERAVNQMERLEMDDEIDEFMEAKSKYDPSFTNQEVLDAAASMESSYKQIKQLRKETTELWEDENMSPEEKLKELNRIYREKMELSKDAWMERPGASEDSPPANPGAVIQFEALQETLIDMAPDNRPDYLAEQGLDRTADLLVSLPKKPNLRMRNIYWENSA